jgi:ATP-binding cassette, subfamily B, bacterial
MNVSLNQYQQLINKYLAPQRGRMAVLFVLMSADLILQLALPRVVQTFIDDATAGAALQALLILGAGYLAVAVAQNWTWVGWNYVAQNIGLIATNHIRTDLTLHCLKLDMSFHNARTPGEMIERVDGDVTKLGNFLSGFLVQIALNGALVLGVLIMLFIVDWRVSLPVAVGVVIAFASAGSINTRLAPLNARERQSSAELYGFLEERLAGTEDIRANGATAYVLRRHLERSRDLFRKAIKADIFGLLSWRSLNTAISIGAVVALAVGAVLALDGVISIGRVYLIFAYTNMMANPIEQIMRQFSDLQQATASIGRVQELLNMQSKLIESDVAQLPPGPLGVDMREVSFSYGVGIDGDVERVLQSVSLHVPAGNTLGLLGRTGSGKTTLTRLLLRLYDPLRGEVCLGGVNVRDVPNADMRQRVGIVTQDIQLFNASVRDNLTFFDPAIPDARIAQALEELGLNEWLHTLPNGLDSQLATGGTGLSAGEAQLLAFARVFLHDPGLVILDEASSRLDPATERRLTHAVERLLAGRTGIIIAHRLSTVQRVDQILILEDGHVREDGPREQLVRDPDSRFAQLLHAGIEETLA